MHLYCDRKLNINKSLDIIFVNYIWNTEIRNALKKIESNKRSI